MSTPRQSRLDRSVIPATAGHLGRPELVTVASLPTEAALDAQTCQGVAGEEAFDVIEVQHACGPAPATPHPHEVNSTARQLTERLAGVENRPEKIRFRGRRRALWVQISFSPWRRTAACRRSSCALRGIVGLIWGPSAGTLPCIG